MMLGAPVSRVSGSGQFQGGGRALIDLAKQAQRTGLTVNEAQIMLDWAQEYNVTPALNHIGTTHWIGGDHIRIGPYRHIPVR